MFKTLGTYLVKAAAWCLGHPDEVVKVASFIKAKAAQKK